VPLQLIDPSDCSPPDNPDNVTYGATATLTVPYGVITWFEITPMSPMTFTVFGKCCGHPSQTYSVALVAGSPPPAKLTLTPATLTVDPFSLGKFTAAAPGATITGIQWSMIDALGNITSCPGGSLTCEILIKRDGKLTVTASVDGLLQQASADITVTKVPCPTGDTLLDLPQVRNLLKQAWVDSKPADAMANRLERSFWLLRDPATGVLTTVPAYDPKATPCSAVPPLPGNSLPLEILAGFHTHPPQTERRFRRTAHRPESPGSDTMRRSGGGPIKGDWNFANTGNGLPICVEDKDDLYRAKPISPVNPNNPTRKSRSIPSPLSTGNRL
jgi:hypothetical protein